MLTTSSNVIRTITSSPDYLKSIPLNKYPKLYYYSSSNTTEFIIKQIEWINKFVNVYDANIEQISYAKVRGKNKESDLLDLIKMVKKIREEGSFVLFFEEDIHVEFLCLLESNLIDTICLYKEKTEDEIDLLVKNLGVYPYSSPYILHYFTDIVDCMTDIYLRCNPLECEINDDN